jgi:WD40 repeat protein
MADIFISYSKQDQQIAQELARYFEREGYAVWWDTQLIGGETYRGAIDQQLDKARAVVVIWTPNSIKSEWVISEAEHAAMNNILVPVRVADLPPAAIPKPFTQRQTELVDNRKAIMAAIKRLGVEPKDASAAGLHDTYWKDVEQSDHFEDYELYLKEYPDGVHAPFARLKIARLKRAAKPGGEPAAQRSQTKPASAPAARMPHQPLTLGLLLLLAVAIPALAVWHGSQLNSLGERLAELMGRTNSIATEVDRQKAADDAAWARAEASDLIEGWKHYLSRRPAGAHADEADARIKKRLDDGRTIAELKGHTDAILRVEFVGDGLVSRGENGQIFAWTIAKKSGVQQAGGEKIDRKANRTTNGALRYSGSRNGPSFKGGVFWLNSGGNGYILYFNTNGTDVVLDSAIPSGDGMLSALPIDGRFSLVSFAGRAYIFDHTEKQTRRFANLDVAKVGGGAFDRSQTRLIIGLEKQLQSIRLSDATPQIILDGHTDTVMAGAYSPDGKLAASGGDDKVVRVWDLSDL